MEYENYNYGGSLSSQPKPKEKLSKARSPVTSFGKNIVSDSNDKVDFAEYLDKNYEGVMQSAIQEDNETKTESLRNEHKNLNTALSYFGFPKLGDLFSNNLFEIENTLKCVAILLQQRQKDLESRSETFEKINKLESEKKSLSENIERLMIKKKSLENDLANSESKYKLLEKTTKETVDKINSEKEEMKKAIYKMQGKETQFQHELRKKDTLLKKFQDQIEKIQNDKKKLFYNNNFELSEAIEKNGPNLFSSNGDPEFTQLMVKGYEDMHCRLLTENDTLRENIIRINDELNEILNLRREFLIKTRKIEMGDEYTEDLDLNYSNLINFKKELLSMPMDAIGKETLEILQENIKKFKEFMKKMDDYNSNFLNEINDENDPELDKITPLRNLKNLIKNYKCVIESQDNLINKAIVKTNYEETEGENKIKKENKIMDDREIEQSRKFLLDQKNYLDQKNKEMEITKSLINQTTKKLDEEKIFIAQKRQEIDEEMEKNKENFQNLIDKFMEFLNETIPEDYDSKNEESNQIN